MENGEWESVIEELEGLSIIIAADMRFLTNSSMECVHNLLHHILQSPFMTETKASSLRFSTVAIRLSSSLYRYDSSTQSTDDVIQCFHLLQQQIESFQKDSPRSLLQLYTADEYWIFLSLFWKDGETPSAFQFTESFHYLFLNSFSQTLRLFSTTEREMILNALTRRKEASTFTTVYIIQLLIASLSSSCSPLFLVSLYYNLLRLTPRHCFQAPQPDFSSMLLFRTDVQPQTLLDWWEDVYGTLTGAADTPSTHTACSPYGKLTEMRDRLIQLVLSSTMWMKLLDRVATIATNPESVAMEEGRNVLHTFCLLLGVLFSNYGISTARIPFSHYP